MVLLVIRADGRETGRQGFQLTRPRRETRRRTMVEKSREGEENGDKTATNEAEMKKMDRSG